MVQVEDGVCAGAGGDDAAHQQHGEEEDEAVLRFPDHSHISGVGVYAETYKNYVVCLFGMACTG